MSKEIKKQYKKIDFSQFIEPERSNSAFGTKALLWLDIILTAGGKISCRSKENFLKTIGLEHTNKFLKSIGINKNFKKIPKKSSFSQYKKRVDLDKFEKYLSNISTKKILEDIKKKGLIIPV